MEMISEVCQISLNQIKELSDIFESNQRAKFSDLLYILLMVVVPHGIWYTRTYLFTVQWKCYSLYISRIFKWRDWFLLHLNCMNGGTMGFSCQIFTWTSQDFPSTVDIVMCYFRKGAFRITLSVFWMKSLCILVLEIISGIDMFIFNRTLNHFFRFWLVSEKHCYSRVPNKLSLFPFLNCESALRPNVEKTETLAHVSSIKPR